MPRGFPRFALASANVAMIDDGLGFPFVLSTPSLEMQLSWHVSGVTCDDGGVDWGFGCNRGSVCKTKRWCVRLRDEVSSRRILDLEIVTVNRYAVRSLSNVVMSWDA